MTEREKPSRQELIEAIRALKDAKAEEGDVVKPQRAEIKRERFFLICQQQLNESHERLDEILDYQSKVVNIFMFAKMAEDMDLRVKYYVDEEGEIEIEVFEKGGYGFQK